MRARLTASMLDRAAACPGSVALPRRPHEGGHAATGRDIHEYLDEVTTVGRAAALDALEDPDLQSRCAAIDLGAIPAGAESEVAFAYDPATDRAERLDLDAHRAYPEDDARIFGTADRVGMRSATEVYVSDFKTGAAKRAVRDSLQLRLLALAAARFARVEAAEVSMLNLRHDGKWITDAAHLDAFDLDDTRAQLLDIQRRTDEARRVVAAGGLPTLVPGLHCEYCPAAPECPAQERQQRALALRDEESIGAWFAGLDEAEAGRLAEQAIVIAKLAANVREAANERAEGMPDGLPLPSGRVLKRVAWGVTIQTDAAKEELATLKAALRERGEISTGKSWQMRVVGRARKDEA